MSDEARRAHRGSRPGGGFHTPLIGSTRARHEPFVIFGVIAEGVSSSDGLQPAIGAVHARLIKRTLPRSLNWGLAGHRPSVAAAWARLRVELGNFGKSMPINDSWIAATALAHNLAIATQDDYDDDCRS
jgi:hypothetical protein